MDVYIFTKFSIHLVNISNQAILKTDYSSSQYCLEMGQTLSVSVPAVQILDFYSQQYDDVSDRSVDNQT